jgi:hypothetical protein
MVWSICSEVELAAVEDTFSAVAGEEVAEEVVEEAAEEAVGVDVADRTSLLLEFSGDFACAIRPFLPHQTRHC